MKRIISWSFAERCAWRAVYVYLGERQVFHVGIDPSAGPGPSFFAAFHPFCGLGLRGRWPVFDSVRVWLYRLGEVRFVVPHIRWRSGMPAWKLALYRRQGRILHGLDGRFGWGTGAK